MQLRLRNIYNIRNLSADRGFRLQCGLEQGCRDCYNNQVNSIRNMQIKSVYTAQLMNVKFIIRLQIGDKL